MATPLSESEFEKKAKSVLLELCGTDRPNPYISPFQGSMVYRRILSPYNYVPNHQLMMMMATIAQENNEAGFYLTVYDRPPENERRSPYHWYISFHEIDSYESDIGMCAVLPNIVYSPQATWGAISDIEGIGVLGANENLGKRFEAVLPHPEEDILDFFKIEMTLRGWANKKRAVVDFSWVPKLLEYCVGQKLAEEYMRKVGW
jgi:hypothetical protein